MGNGASVIPSEYTNEQKAEIARERYDAISATEEGKKMTDAEILKVVEMEYEKSATKFLPQRKKSSGIIQFDAASSMAAPITGNKSVGKPDLKKAASSRVAFTHLQAESVPLDSIIDAQLRANLAQAKNNDEILSTAPTKDGQEQALAEFLNKLNLGQNEEASSGFRQRRLSAAQRIVETTVEELPKKALRTSVYAAAELGAREELSLPFTANVLGKFSCHGIEPANNPSGVHDKINQDRGCYVYPFNNAEDEMLFIVLDGHGQEGDRVSEFCMQQIVVTLEAHPSLAANPGAALIDTFETTNRALTSTKIQYYSSGCTCVTVLMRGSTLWVANVGDSRAVVATTDNKGRMRATGLTRDHKPNDPDEKARITSMGGFVSPPPEPGLSSRVWLDAKFKMIGLAMSRSLGDYAVKAVGVTATPEITTHELSENDKFIIMASDGVWEFISNQEAVDIVQSKIAFGAHVACEELIRQSAARWQHEEGDYRDDVSQAKPT
eukprot:gene7805-15970_t